MINSVSFRACFGVRAGNSNSSGNANQSSNGFAKTVGRLFKSLFQCKSASANETNNPPAGELALDAQRKSVPLSTGNSTDLLARRSGAAGEATTVPHQDELTIKVGDLFLKGMDEKLPIEIRHRLLVALSMTKAWGGDLDPLVRFTRANTVESMPEPAELFTKLKQAEPAPQALQRMLALIQKKFYPMIERVLNKPDVAAQSSTWLCTALGGGKVLPKVEWLSQLDAPMLQQFARLLESLVTDGSTPANHHAQALALVKKAQLIQTLVNNKVVNMGVWNTLTDEQKNDKDVAIAVASNKFFDVQKLSLPMRANKEVMTAAVKRNGYALAYASEQLKANWDVVYQAVGNHGGALKYASHELRAHPEMVLHAFKGFRGDFNIGKVDPFEFASGSLKNDRSFVLKLMSVDVASLAHANRELRGDHEVVKAAVSSNGKALKYASAALKDNKEIVLLAVKNSPRAFKHASGTLQKDRDVLLVAASTTRFDDIREANPTIHHDDELMKIAVRHHPQALMSARETLRDNKELVMEVVSKKGASTAEFLSQKFQDDKDVMMAAVSSHGMNLKYASKRLKNDKEVVLAAVRSIKTSNSVIPVPLDFDNVLAHASKRLRSNKEVVLAAVSTLAEQINSVVDPTGNLRSDKSIARAVFSAPDTQKYIGHGLNTKKSRFDFLSSDFRKDREFVMEVVSKSGRNLEHVDASLRNDKQVVKAAYLQNPDSLKFASDELKNDSAFVREIYMESQKYKSLTSG